MKKVKIGNLKDLEKNNQFSRWVEDHDILIYQFNNKIRAISNICPHFGGPIGYHEIKKKNGVNVFTCLWHNPQYNIDTGKCLTQKNFCLRKYEVSLEQSDIYVYIN